MHVCVIQSKDISGAHASVYRHTFSAIKKFNVIENVSSLRNGLHLFCAVSYSVLT